MVSCNIGKSPVKAWLSPPQRDIDLLKSTWRYLLTNFDHPFRCSSKPQIISTPDQQHPNRMLMCRKYTYISLRHCRRKCRHTQCRVIWQSRKRSASANFDDLVVTPHRFGFLVKLRRNTFHPAKRCANNPARSQSSERRCLYGNQPLGSMENHREEKFST